MDSLINEVKDQNSDMIGKAIDRLADRAVVLPVGQLAVLFHAANGLGVSWGMSNDLGEKRNRAYLESINPRLEGSMLNAIISGSFKPDAFIHPYNDFYTIPGYLDFAVLPEFFDAVDDLARGYRASHDKPQKEEFLSFVYMFFLMIHPFVDGNGRVARNLLDYYEKALSLKLAPVWSNEASKFASHEFHKVAFDTFFSIEARVRPYKYKKIHSFHEVSSLLVLRKEDLIMLART
ncbi:MAG: Fic family protein, partial [Desulfomonilaceae bacterium]